MKTPILILAAGSSSRLGEPKQLLPFKGGTLLSHTIQECIASNLGEVYVVTGAYYKSVSTSIQGLDCRIFFNPNWSEGLSTSIAFGISQLPSDAEACYLVLGDQPYFTKVILEKIKTSLKTNAARIILSRYDKGQGPPAYFEASLFEEMKTLRGDDGAKAIVKKYKKEVQFIGFSLGYLDVDVPVDKARLKDS